MKRTPISHAFLYAAGVGNRLGPDLGDEPKVLLEFGGKSLLERHVENLARVGIERLVIVVGHKCASITRALVPLRERYAVDVEEIFNPHFREGSVLSLDASLARLCEVNGPVLLMDGDVLYPPAILERLIASPSPTALLIDREWSATDDDPVLVPLENGRPFEFRKRFAGAAEAVGESIGFFKVGLDDIHLLVAETKLRVRESRRTEPYEEVLRAMVLGDRFAAVDVTDLPWIEIDFPEDVEKARREVLPLIEKVESQERTSA